MYLFFDTETTGTPKDYKAPISNVDNWPRITQLAYVICNEQGEIESKVSSIILPDGWTIPTKDELIAQGNKNPNFFIDNNMSTERCFREGKPLPSLIDEFLFLANDCKFIIAHNISFDWKVLGAELIRYNKTQAAILNDMKRICTMMSSTKHCQLPGAYGFKWPKLEELHRVLFSSDFDGAHDALADVLITAKCFFELKKLGVIEL